jgi:hypothetical protein
MEESSELMAFYIIKEHDNSGKSAHGPYMMADAESRVREGEKFISQTLLSTLRLQAPPTDKDWLDYTPGNWPLHDKMVQEVKQWGAFLIIIGIVQIVASGVLSNTWGILLIVVGLASYYFRSAAMFGIYGTTLAWASISNALSGAGVWGIFSVLQVFFAFQTFRQFFRYRTALASLNSVDIDIVHINDFFKDKAARPFPWISFVLGLLSFFGIIAVFLGAIISVGFTGVSETPPLIIFVEGLVIDFAVVGFAAGFSSLFLKYKYKLLSIVGMVTSVLVLLIEIGFSFL